MTNHNIIILNIIRSRPDLANAISQYNIADECMRRSSEHITARAVRRIIEDLIEQGYPIISTPHYPGGYSWGNNSDEVLECINRLRKKAAKIFIRARRIKRNCLAEKAKRKEWEQLSLELVG